MAEVSSLVEWFPSLVGEYMAPLDTVQVSEYTDVGVRGTIAGGLCGCRRFSDVAWSGVPQSMDTDRVRPHDVTFRTRDNKEMVVGITCWSRDI